MSKILSQWEINWGSWVLENSASVSYWDILSLKDGYLWEPVAWDIVEWVSLEAVTVAADNETIKRTKVQYLRMSDDTELLMDVTWGTITQADVGSLFNTTWQNVDWAGTAAVAKVVDVTPSNVEIGDVFTVTINGTPFEYTALAATVADVTAWLEALINAWAEPVTAVDGSTKITLTADVAGVDFTVSTSAVDWGVADTQTLEATTVTANVLTPSQLLLKKVVTSTKGVFVRGK